MRQEHRKFISQYKVLNHELGKGSFATVFLGVHKGTQVPVAIKIIDKESI